MPNLAALVWSGALLSAASTLSAHNLDQVNTYLAFDNATINRMEARSQAEEALIQQDDEIGLVFKSTPGPGTTYGASGYFTFYVPVGTQVVGLEYGRPNGSGSFSVLPIKRPAEMPIGNGSISASTTTALIGLTLGPNITGQTSTAVSASGAHRGTLAGVYADTGLFFSTDPATAWNTFVGRGGFDGNPATNDNVLVNNNGNSLTPTNFWDAGQLVAFGIRSPVSPIVDPDGRGAAPWGMASPVAGPQSGYAWAFDWAYWRANPSDPARMRNSIKMGPWQRIRYQGSTAAFDQPGQQSTNRGYALLDASHIGTPVSLAEPLPPTLDWTDDSSPKALRIAFGELKLGFSEFGRVRLKVLANAGEPDSPFSPDGGIKFFSDVSGGDAGGSSNGKDHVWRYIKASPLEQDTRFLFQKRFIKTAVMVNETSYFDLVVANTGVNDLQNVVIQDPMPAGLSYVSASVTPNATNPLRWNIGTLPSQGFRRIRVHFRATQLGLFYNTAQMTWQGGSKSATDSINATKTGSPVSPPELAVGNLVFLDRNGNGRADAGEGLAGVTIQLYEADHVPGVDPPRASQVTNELGAYLFGGLEEEQYKVHLPAAQFQPGGLLAGMLSVPGVGTADDDVDEDGIDAPQPWVTGISSRSFWLRTDAAPTAATGETGFMATLDDDDDANTDLTIDLGLRYPHGIGNAVFLDADGNGKMDAGEGVPNVPVRLYRGDQTPGVDPPLASTVTAANGTYYFGDLAEGPYKVHIPASTFQAGGALHGRIPIAHTPQGDDDAGSNGIFAGDPALHGVSSNLVTLAPGTAPTLATGETGFMSHTDDAIDSHVDLTIDFGFMQPVGLGNLVFVDDNDNGRYDAGEGVGGVPVELYQAGQVPGVDAPLAVMETAADGHYYFGNLSNGQYVAHIPARAFYPGAALEGYSAIALGLAGDDDVGQNGIKAGEPEWEGVSSGVVSLALGSAPTFQTGETGYRSGDDDAFDAAVDLTIDFGFQRVLGVGNLVFVDHNGNGVFDYGEGVGGVRVELYRADQTPGVDQPILVEHSDADGVYLFDQLTPGGYRLFIPPAEFGFGRPLWRLRSLPGTQEGDDDMGEKGLDDAAPESNGIMTAVFTLARGTMPVDGGTETGGFNQMDNRNDADYDLTRDFGFAAPAPDEVGVGNLVFVDANGNGRYDAGEGRDGVRVELFRAGDDPQSAEPLAWMRTSGEGIYLFAGLEEGAYFVHVPASEFQAGGALEGLLSVPGAGGDWGLDDDFDENGIDSDEPWETGISSVVFYLSPDNEPVNSWGETGRDAFMDDADDDNMDLTIDLGFSVPMGLGNLVFVDANGNGRADAGEGAPGVSVQLFAAGTDPSFGAPLAETVTDGQGRYLFEGLAPGLYFAHIPAAMFAAGAPLHGLVSLAGTQEGDDDLGEKGVDNPQPEWFGISSVWVALQPGQAPAGAAESGMFGDMDDGFDANVDLTVDFGFGQPASLGDLVFHDVNGDGLRQADGADGLPGTGDDEAGLAGVRLELWSPGADGVIGGGDDVLVVEEVETDAQGRYAFTRLSPGRYYAVVAASNFAPGGALAGLPVSSPVRSGSDDGVDNDNNGEQPGGRGTAAYGPVVTLAPGQDNGTVDFGFLANLQPLSWPEWQRRHGALGDVSPGGNSDGDGWSNLAEFAFGLNPRSGLVKRRPVRLEIDQATRQVDVLVERVTDIAGLSYELQVIGDLLQSPQGWQTVTGIAPVVTHRADGTEEARFNAVSSLPGLAARGQVRVRVSLDSDLNGEAEAEAYSPVQGWSRVELGTHLQTFGQGHVKATRLTGRVGAVSGGALELGGSLDGGEDVREAFEPGAQYYVEVLDGPHAGHRLEVNEAASQGVRLVIDTGAEAAGRNTLAGAPPGTLAGARVALRRHVTLDELAPRTLFRATTNASTADRVLLYDPAGAAFRSYWLLAYPGAARWVLQGDASLSNRGGLVLEPGLGLFAQPRTWNVTLMLSGEVREQGFARPLPAGMSLVGTGWPLDLSPAQLGMNEAGGFMGASNASLADQLQVWRGDAVAGQTSYDGYYLLRAGSLRQWVAQGDSKLTNHNSSALLRAHRSLFVRSRNGLTSWVMPCPWTPY